MELQLGLGIDDGEYSLYLTLLECIKCLSVNSLCPGPPLGKVVDTTTEFTDRF